MNHGFDRPLYLLPFDHRHSYLSGMFGFKPPLTPEQHARVVDSKRLIFEGFLKAIEAGVPIEKAGILVDEEFGSAVLHDAKRAGAMTVVSVESSGSDEFDFEYGEDFAAHIEAFDPSFAKVLVRYNVDGDAALNSRQSTRLARLSQWCSRKHRRLMFELLVPANPAQLASVGGDAAAFDRDARPDLMARAIVELQDAGVEADIWKIEGLDSRESCERIVAVAQRGGREGVSCIVLGRGAHDDKVAGWLETAAGVPGFVGFAVGRTTFWDAVHDFETGAATRDQAADRIAMHFREWVEIFDRGRAPTGTVKAPDGSAALAASAAPAQAAS